MPLVDCHNIFDIKYISNLKKKIYYEYYIKSILIQKSPAVNLLAGF